MPATSFLEYARTIQNVVDTAIAAAEATLVRIEIDPRSAFRGFIGGVIQFPGASELHFREFVDTTAVEPRTMYAYHYQDADKALVFRYDNALHRPRLHQMEHKHVQDKVQISVAPTLDRILDEILENLQ